MNILSKAISSLLLLLFIFYGTRSKQNVVFKSLIISKLKLSFLLTFEYSRFYTGRTRCRLQTFDRIYILSKYISYLGFAFALYNFFFNFHRFLKGLACQFQECTPRDYFFVFQVMQIIKALVEYMFTLRGHLQHQEISSFV